MGDHDSLLLTPAQAARRLGCSKRALRRFVAAGELNCVRLGHKLVRYEPAELQRLIRNHSTNSETLAGRQGLATTSDDGARPTPAA